MRRPFAPNGLTPTRCTQTPQGHGCVSSHILFTLHVPVFFLSGPGKLSATASDPTGPSCLLHNSLHAQLPHGGDFAAGAQSLTQQHSAESGVPFQPLRDLVDRSLPSPSGPGAPSPTLQKHIQADRNLQQECSVLSVWATNSWKPAGAFRPGPEVCRPLVGASHSAHPRTCCIQAVAGCAGVVVTAAPPGCWVSHRAV